MAIKPTATRAQESRPVQKAPTKEATKSSERANAPKGDEAKSGTKVDQATQERSRKAAQQIENAAKQRVNFEPSVEDLSATAVKGLQDRIQKSNLEVLASGGAARGAGRSAQDREIKRAFRDFAKATPFGAINEEIARPLTSLLGKAGVDTASLPTTTLGELFEGGDSQEASLLSRTNDDTGFNYNVGLGGVTGFGPSAEVSRTFGNHEASLGGEYLDGGFNAKLSYSYKGDSLTAEANFAYRDELSGEASLLYTPNDRFQLSLDGKMGPEIDDRVRLDAHYQFSETSVFNLSTGYNFGTDAFDAKATYTYQPNEDFGMQFNLEHSERESFAGFGLSARF